uniref:(northern house mosquito) hypothetical protein n=1 Tax=Culex pipiens TaxID=7175 RepID=A0A8D8IYS3_CULPI
MGQLGRFRNWLQRLHLDPHLVPSQQLRKDQFQRQQTRMDRGHPGAGILKTGHNFLQQRSVPRRVEKLDRPRLQLLREVFVGGLQVGSWHGRRRHFCPAHFFTERGE